MTFARLTAKVRVCTNVQVSVCAEGVLVGDARWSGDAMDRLASQNDFAVIYRCGDSCCRATGYAGAVGFG